MLQASDILDQPFGIFILFRGLHTVRRADTVTAARLSFELLNGLLRCLHHADLAYGLDYELRAGCLLTLNSSGLCIAQRASPMKKSTAIHCAVIAGMCRGRRQAAIPLTSAQEIRHAWIFCLCCLALLLSSVQQPGHTHQACHPSYCTVQPCNYPQRDMKGAVMTQADRTLIQSMHTPHTTPAAAGLR